MPKSLVLLKPDAVESKVVGDLLSRFEKLFDIAAMKMVKMEQGLCRLHYEEHLAKDFYPGLEKFMTGGPLVAVALEGDGRLIRQTAMLLRKEFNPSYVSGPRNLIHASDGPESAAREIALWFPELAS